MNLYQINQVIQNYLDQADHESGEIDGEIFEAIGRLEIEQSEKVLSLGTWIKNLTAESDAIANEIKQLQTRKKALENKADGVRDYLASTISGKQFRNAQCVIGWRASKSVEILDAERLPEDLVKIKIEKAPDKKAIKEAIESGLDLDGVARIVENLNIQIK